MTGKPDDIERVTSGLEGGRRKRSRKTTSPAAYPTTRVALARREARADAGRYLAGLYPLEDFAPLLRTPAGPSAWTGPTAGSGSPTAATAWKTGCERTSRGSRGSSWILSPGGEAHRTARLLYPQDQERADEHARQWRQLLKDEGGAVLAAVLSEWEWPRRPGLREAVDELIGYLERTPTAWSTPNTWPTVGASAAARWRAL